MKLNWLRMVKWLDDGLERIWKEMVVMAADFD
jgi:hypothetical protein